MLTRTDGNTAYINIVGTLSQTTTAGIWNGTTVVSSLQSDDTNLLLKTRNNEITGTITSNDDLTSIKIILMLILHLVQIPLLLLYFLQVL